MSLAILDSSSLDRNKWAKLVTVSESSTFYHTLDWSLVWEKSFDFCQPLFFVEEKNSEYSLGLPVVKFKKKGLESFFSMPMGTYGGLIYLKLVESEAEEFLRQVLTRLNNKRDLRLQIVDYFDRFPFLNRLGLVKKDGFTHLLDLRGVALKQLLVKRGFQQSVKRGVKIRMIDNKKDLGACYKLYLKTCQRHRNRPKYTEPFYENLFVMGKDSDWLKWWLAEKGSEVIAYKITFVFKDWIYFWDSGSNPEYLQLRPNDFLMGQCLSWAKNNGLSFFNMGGSPRGAEGVVQYKKQWGGKEIKYSIYEKTFPLGKLVDLIRGR